MKEIFLKIILLDRNKPPVTTQDEARVAQTLNVLLRGHSSSKANKINLCLATFLLN